MSYKVLQLAIGKIGINYLRNLSQVIKMVRQVDFVLLSHSNFPPLIPVTFLLRLLGAKVVFDYPYDIITSEFFKRLRLNYLLMFTLLQASNLVLIERARRYIGKKFRLKASKLYFIDNLPIIDLIEKLKNKTPTVKFPSNKFIIAYSGNIFFHRIEYFIPIYRRMIDFNDNIQLVIMSGPETIREVDEMARRVGIRDKILYVDIKPYEEFIPIINQCDMWIGLLDDESLLGRTSLRTELLELMALGKPCVCAHTDAIKLHPFKDGKNIILINPHDIEGSAKKLLRYINDKEKLALIGPNAKKTVHEHFNYKKEVKKFLDAVVEMK